MAHDHHHHAGNRSDEGSQLSGILAMVMLLVFTFGMFFASISFSGSAGEGSAARPAPTVARR